MKNLTSKFLSLGTSDAVKAFWMFLFATVISVLGDAVMQAVTNGTYSLDAIHWREIVAAVVVAILAYLKKQFVTNETGQILTKDKKDA